MNDATRSLDSKEIALDIRSYLETVCLIRQTMPTPKGWAYSSIEHLLLKEAQTFSVGPMCPETGPAQMCYRNAMLFAAKLGWIYAEGYALPSLRTPIPILHAWLIDKKGRARETTWTEPGLAYVGVPIRLSALLRNVSETGYPGMLDSWQNGHPVLSGKITRAEWRETT